MIKAPAGWSGAGLPSYVRFACYAHAVLASAFLACVVVQVFFAGIGIFAANWSFHTYFVPLFELMLPPAFVLAFVGRLPLALKLSPVGLWFLVTVQYALANLDGPDVVAALHPANGLLIFWASLEVARRSWRIATERKKG
jgi:cytochrome b subunit of formate dehydrogenase